MDNYRGFAETLVPLPNATFLVGENSTGKSSFLALVHLLSNSNFVISPDSSGGAFGLLGGFKDIVSITSADKSCFSIGTLATITKSGAKKAPPACTFSIMTFRDEEGLPRIQAHSYYLRGKLVEVRFKGDQTYYKVTDNLFPTAVDCDSLPEFFLRIYREISKNTNGFTKAPGHIPRGAPFPLILAMLNSKNSRETPDLATLFAEFPAFLSSGMISWTWLAPIRTRPLRIYEGFKTDFTPEGDHTPYLIRRTLSSSDKATKFVEVKAVW